MDKISKALASAMMTRKTLKAELDLAQRTVERLSMMVEQADITVERLKEARSVDSVA